MLHVLGIILLVLLAELTGVALMTLVFKGYCNLRRK